MIGADVDNLAALFGVSLNHFISVVLRGLSPLRAIPPQADGTSPTEGNSRV